MNTESSRLNRHKVVSVDGLKHMPYSQYILLMLVFLLVSVSILTHFSILQKIQVH